MNIKANPQNRLAFVQNLKKGDHVDMDMPGETRYKKRAPF